MTDSICPECQRDIRTPNGCDQTLIYRYGEEPHVQTYREELPTECNDCGCPFDGYHHRYCDVAWCLSCDDQRLCCDHGLDEEP